MDLIKLQAENARLRAVLQIYADPETYWKVLGNFGDFAWQFNHDKIDDEQPWAIAQDALKS